ncbi:MAG: ParB/RepB/Spo0J family partition protein [Halothiobacillaceae bacterium]|jgi:ParB family chromosome partitioning protein|nr:ParB/RepB/Spo0J family partition protein [Halothiobacillaceae bacterium]MDY0050393.1 ParB/RepB/Spo0J family partition protein [Halothiobacillaceae bacterium]
MSVKKRGLGRGLDVLLGVERQEGGTGPELREIAIGLIHPSPYQPRQVFEPEALQGLADSIRAQGVIQPLVVRARAGEYELIAGERRWRAAQLAGLSRVPAVIREVDDTRAAALALIENLQREDLNPLEEAQGMRRLIEGFGLTHQQVAEALGYSRPTVSNTLRLLELAEPVQEMLATGDLDMGHARALLPLPREMQFDVARRVAARGYTVRDVEKLVQARLEPAPSRPEATPDADWLAMERRLSERLGAEVHLRPGARGRGQLQIRFDSLAQLDGILALLGVGEE